MFRKPKQPKQPKQPAAAKSSNKRGLASTQQHVAFSEIRDNVVIMKDGTLRAVLAVSSINFALKSEDEQKGIVQAYVSFLNTIDFEVQIVIQSRNLNIDNYLENLDSLARQQDNELLRRQTQSYRAFIAKLVEGGDIMDKRFYVVVPYSASNKKRKSYWSRLQEVFRAASVVRLGQTKFVEYEDELRRRVASVTSGLDAIGLVSQQLDTQSLIELYYNTYNPISKQQKRIDDIDALQIDRTIQ